MRKDTDPLILLLFRLHGARPKGKLVLNIRRRKFADRVWVRTGAVSGITKDGIKTGSTLYMLLVRKTSTKWLSYLAHYIKLNYFLRGLCNVGFVRNEI